MDIISSLVAKNPTFLYASCIPFLDWQVIDRTSVGPRHQSSLRFTPNQKPTRPVAGTASTLDMRSWLRSYAGHRSPASTPGPQCGHGRDHGGRSVTACGHIAAATSSLRTPAISRPSPIPGHKDKVCAPCPAYAGGFPSLLPMAQCDVMVRPCVSPPCMQKG